MKNSFKRLYDLFIDNIYSETVKSQNIGSIVGNGNLNIDMNLAGQTSDKINLANASSGTLTINSVNIIDPATTQIDKISLFRL